MPSIYASCVCSADPNTGLNRDNLLFAGQLLPERNGGLSGTPGTQAESPFVAAVFRGYGPDGSGAAAAHRVANALHDSEAALDGTDALPELLFPLCAERPDGSGLPMGCSTAAVRFAERTLTLAACGACRAYLIRDRALFLLTSMASADAPPYTLSGTPHAGDRLLLCTGTLAEVLSAQQMLTICTDAKSDAEALKQLLHHARAQGAQGSVTAILLRVE